MIPFVEALETILSYPLPRQGEDVPLLRAGGRYLASSVRAPWPLPAFDNSSMDGFAVVASDLAGAGESNPVTLEVCGESAAGHPFQDPPPKGCVIRISTGAPIPAGFDTVVPIERVVASEGAATFREVPRVGAFIRRRGEDVAGDAQLFGCGKLVDAATLAFLSMYNLPTLPVLRRPRVAIITSGEEVRPHGAILAESEIVGSNIYYLEEELKACGCDARVRGISTDDPEDYRRLVEECLEDSDVIVSTAGVSVGEHDVVQAALRELKARLHFWKISVRPGKPTLFAHLGEKPFFGLPGNPAAVCCNTEILLKPFLRKSFGVAPVVKPTIPMKLLTDCPRDRTRLWYQTARHAVIEGVQRVEPIGNGSSGNLGAVAHSNGLIMLEPGESPLAAGTIVDVMDVRPGLG